MCNIWAQGEIAREKRVDRSPGAVAVGCAKLTISNTFFFHGGYLRVACILPQDVAGLHRARLPFNAELGIVAGWKERDGKMQSPASRPTWNARDHMI